MRYALFLGCRIPAEVPAYERSTRAVARRLGIDLVDLPFACCGDPVRSVDRDAFVAAAARNLALARRAGLPVLAPCKCCFGSLRHAQRFLEQDAALRRRVDRLLSVEGLPLPDGVQVRHLLQVLRHEVGPEALKVAARSPRTGLRVAAHYGCHALRPGDVTGFDHPLAPTIFEDLVRAAGAEPVDWPRRLDCCGQPVEASDPALSDRMARAKVRDALENGADVLATACPHCHVRFAATMAAPGAPALPSLLYPQLLGLALGLSPAALGLPGDHPATRAPAPSP